MVRKSNALKAESREIRKRVENGRPQEEVKEFFIAGIVKEEV